jgi:hypothetical protein
MMTDKDCNDFAELVRKMQENDKKQTAKKPKRKKKLKNYVRKIKSTSSRTSGKATRKS